MKYENRYIMVEKENGRFNITDKLSKFVTVQEDGSKTPSLIVGFNMTKEHAERQIRDLNNAMIRRLGTSLVETL